MNTRTKLICIFALLATGLGFWIYCQTVTAQVNASSASIAFCNPPKVLMGYRRFMLMNHELMAEKDRIQKQVVDAQKAIKAEADDLAASGLLPDSEDYKRRRKELVKKSIQNQAFAKFSEADLPRQEQQMKEVCFRDAVGAVGKIAKQKGLVLVVQQALYVDGSLDITAEVIEQLNTDYELRR